MKKKFFACLLMIFLFSCSSFDNKIDEARKYIETINSKENYNSNIKLVDFKKVNGEEFVRNGHIMYKITYLATFEALENGTIYTKEDNTAFVTRLYSEEEVASGIDCDRKGDYQYKEFAPFKRDLKLHETFLSKGDVILLKTDNGWEAKTEYQ